MQTLIDGRNSSLTLNITLAVNYTVTQKPDYSDHCE